MKKSVAQSIADRRILVVEDEYLIADDLCRTLRAAGAIVVGPVATVPEGLELARRERLDAAVIDVNLGGEMSYAIATELDARKVPYLFATGYDCSALPAAWRRVPHIEKPFVPDRIVEMLSGLLIPQVLVEARP